MTAAVVRIFMAGLVFFAPGADGGSTLLLLDSAHVGTETFPIGPHEPVLFWETGACTAPAATTGELSGPVRQRLELEWLDAAGGPVADTAPFDERTQPLTQQDGLPEDRASAASTYFLPDIDQVLGETARIDPACLAATGTCDRVLAQVQLRHGQLRVARLISPDGAIVPQLEFRPLPGAYADRALAWAMVLEMDVPAGAATLQVHRYSLLDGTETGLDTLSLSTPDGEPLRLYLGNVEVPPAQPPSEPALEGRHFVANYQILDAAQRSRVMQDPPIPAFKQPGMYRTIEIQPDDAACAAPDKWLAHVVPGGGQVAGGRWLAPRAPRILPVARPAQPLLERGVAWIRARVGFPPHNPICTPGQGGG